MGDRLWAGRHDDWEPAPTPWTPAPYRVRGRLFAGVTDPWHA